jgi:hypothetical protein
MWFLISMGDFGEYVWIGFLSVPWAVGDMKPLAANLVVGFSSWALGVRWRK